MRPKPNGAKTVLFVVSGRPQLLVGELADSGDAIVAAWLPGTEGGGVAEWAVLGVSRGWSELHAVVSVGAGPTYL